MKATKRTSFYSCSFVQFWERKQIFGPFAENLFEYFRGSLFTPRKGRPRDFSNFTTACAILFSPLKGHLYLFMYLLTLNETMKMTYHSSKCF